MRTEAAPSDPLEEPAVAGPKRVGVVFVHGVGTSQESDTLIDFGGMLVGWLQRWYRGHQDMDSPRLTRGRLRFDPYDTGASTIDVSNATIELPNGDAWVCVEAWWALSARPLPFTAMLTWSFRHLWGLLWNLAESRMRRLVELNNQPLYLSVLEFVYCGFLIVGYLVTALVGYLLLVPIFVAAQIPYPPLQNFIVLSVLRPFLQYNAAELRTYVEDEIQAANMRRRVAEAVRWLVTPTDQRGGGCEAVTVVAHSGGCWVVYGMLTDPSYAQEAAHVRRLITFGNGLNKIWEIAPGLRRLHGPLTGDIYWVDLWSSYDPVPIQWLDPPRETDDPRSVRVGKLRLGPDSRKWISIYEPCDAVKKWLIPRDTPRPPASGGRRAAAGSPDPTGQYWPESRQVTNRMDTLTDHGGYFTNDEEVLRRIAAEIDMCLVDEPRYERSPFWSEAPPPGPAQYARRKRVAVLAAFRAIAVVAGVVCIIAWSGSLANAVAGIGPLQSIGMTIDEWAKNISAIPLLGGLATTLDVRLKQALAWAVGAAIASLPALIVFEVIRAIWEALDLNARTREVSI
jgi:hypothetical protein